jgi:hypothetical protein
MQSGGRVSCLVASVVRLEPSVEDPDDIVEAVHVSDRDESLTTGDSVLAREGLERGEGKLRLRERQPGLGTKPGVRARSCFLETPRLLVERQQQRRLGTELGTGWYTHLAVHSFYGRTCHKARLCVD